MGKVTDTSYFVVQGWMLNQLHLKGNTLQVFGGYTLTNFCGFCGRPLTDTARQMLEKRLK